MNRTIEKNIEYTIATFAIEQLKPSKDALKLCKENAMGNITLEKAIDTIKDRYRVGRV